jgi:hypothetical protein
MNSVTEDTGHHKILLNKISVTLSGRSLKADGFIEGLKFCTKTDASIQFRYRASSEPLSMTVLIKNK